MSSEGHRHDSFVSLSSVAKTSFRSSRAPPSTVKAVITSPPWARDEPPSPGERADRPLATSGDSFKQLTESRTFDVASYESSIAEEPGPSRWWTFARPRPGATGGSYFDTLPQSMTHPSRSFKGWDRERSLSIPWLSATHRRSLEDHSGAVQNKEEDYQNFPRLSGVDQLRLHIPNAPITLSQNPTPGWETPWTARPRGATFNSRSDYAGDDIPELPNGSNQDGDDRLGAWTRRKKRFRAYLLHNAYVPLLFRFVNIALTTSALAIAIHIRMVERSNDIMGAVGSSPTLVIIFGSLTLVHVMIAIYVEYFGRPLGLWRTSGKLAYTLIEVVFVCAWSAALALSFDNFFTSLIPCASESSISWYSQLPRQTIPGVSSSEGSVGDGICDDQLVLICLVGVGLMMYCFNLVISLFRIFERVKYQPAFVPPT